MGTGVKISTDLETLGNSQVCGQCHGSYTNLSTTLGIYGYTANLAMSDFVDIPIPRHLTFPESTHPQFRIECQKHNGVAHLEQRVTPTHRRSGKHPGATREEEFAHEADSRFLGSLLRVRRRRRQPEVVVNVCMRDRPTLCESATERGCPRSTSASDEQSAGSRVKHGMTVAFDERLGGAALRCASVLSPEESAPGAVDRTPSDT
jgi:hypothetical protein